MEKYTFMVWPTLGSRMAEEHEQNTESRSRNMIVVLFYSACITFTGCIGLLTFVDVIRGVIADKTSVQYKFLEGLNFERIC